MSQHMIEQARIAAEAAGVAQRITFVHARLGELGRFDDGEFDLVVSCDDPVSYTYPDQETALAELTRVARKAIVLSVSSRLGYVPMLMNPIQKEQYLVNAEERGRVGALLSPRSRRPAPQLGTGLRPHDRNTGHGDPPIRRGEHNGG
ncbi:MAG: class I SAM-dependent methyltransferase, partial [Gammaproteobacteria bacterium]